MQSVLIGDGEDSDERIRRPLPVRRIIAPGRRSRRFGQV
jgi:hypothetical protein